MVRPGGRRAGLGPCRNRCRRSKPGRPRFEEQLKGDLSPDEYDRLYMHYQRMKRIYATERQQIDQMLTTQTVTYYQNLRLATLKRELADIYERTAEVLVPTQPSFFERYRKVFRRWALS